MTYQTCDAITAPLATPTNDGTADILIDAATITNLADPDEGGDPVFFEELVGIFESETPNAIATLRSAASSGNPTLLARTAHTLKGSSAYLGALRMRAICDQLESVGRSGKVDGAAQLVVLLNEEIRAAIQALEQARVQWSR